MAKIYIVISMFITAGIINICHGAPLVYVGCDLIDAGGNPSMHTEFTLDEQNQTVSNLRKKPFNILKVQAFFTSEEVTWKPSEMLDVVFSINRTTLAYTQIFGAEGKTSESTGKCVVLDGTKRKF